MISSPKDKEICSLLEELIEEQKATQRSIALQQRKILDIDDKFERFVEDQRTRYKEQQTRRREYPW